MLLIFCCILLILPAQSSVQIHELDVSIANPLFFDVCQDHRVIVLANDQKIEIVTRKNKHSQSFITALPFVGVTWLKCMKRGVVAIASVDTLCLYNISSTQQRCNTFEGKPLSISEDIQTSQQFLILATSQLQLSQVVYYNYTVTLNNPIISSDTNIVKASYVANHQYIYTVDSLSNLAIYESPYSQNAPASKMKLKQIQPIDSISTYRNTQAALLSNGLGDFALIEDGELERTWNSTPYTRGCLCSREKVALANSRNIAIYDSDTKPKVIDGFKLKGDLRGILCSFQEQHHNLYLLDGQGTLLMVQLQQHQFRPSLYILIFIILIIAAVAVKFICFPSRQQMLSTDLEDSKQDQQPYRQLKQMKDNVREDH